MAGQEVAARALDVEDLDLLALEALPVERSCAAAFRMPDAGQRAERRGPRACLQQAAAGRIGMIVVRAVVHWILLFRQWIPSTASKTARLLRGAARRARHREYLRLAGGHFARRSRQVAHGRERNHDGAVAIGMDEVAGSYRHARHGNGQVEGLDVREPVRRPDASGQHLEAWCPLRQVADRAVGDEADRAHSAMDRRLHLAPERAVPGLVAVEILDDDQRGLRSRVDEAIVGVAELAHVRQRAGERLLRADRRGPRVPDHRRRSGKPQTSGRTV